MRRAAKLKPYRQGRRDSLCGIYAIINALRLILRTDHELTQKDYERSSLHELMSLRRGRFRPSRELIRGKFAQLLAEMIDYCEEEFGIEIELRQPLLSGPRRSGHQMINRLRTVLGSPETTILIGFGGLDHRTVVQDDHRSSLPSPR